MRCRKVRSCLSAYCRGELTGRKELAISDHLLTCAGCRREEAIFRNLVRTVGEIPAISVSDDFNARLLNRIARERFAGMRTKAYLPKNAPVFLWRRVVPVAATACLAVLAVIATLSLPYNSGTPGIAQSAHKLDDSYLTVQPDSNPNMTVNLRKDWSLSTQLARAERINRISHTITPAGGFGSWGNNHQLIRMVSLSSRPLPYVANYFRVRPVVRIYISPGSARGEEGLHAY
ncbi:MAG: zf-HC2 domain-containing protein [candidate division Zixibacteria bacterium]|nr:zf-HC2 domain-containing protein [candidate division Zixibacteria bacterium]